MVLDQILSAFVQYVVPVGALLAVILSAKDIYRWARGPILEVQDARIAEYDGPPRPYLSVGVGEVENKGPPKRYWCEVDVANHGSRKSKGTYLGLFQTYNRDEDGKVIRTATMGHTDRRIFRIVAPGDTVTFRRIFHMDGPEGKPVDGFFQVWAIPTSGGAVGAEVHVKVEGEEIDLRNVSFLYRSRWNMFLCRVLSSLSDKWRHRVLDRQSRPFLEMLSNQRKAVEGAKKTDLGIASPRND